MSNKLEQVRLYNQVNEIDRIKASGFSLVSVVLPPGADAKLAEIKQLVSEDRMVVSEEHDVYEKINYKYSGHLNATAILTLLKDRLANLPSVPRNGWVYYAGFWEDEEGKTHSYSSTVEPFAPLAAARAMFIADGRFHTEALHDLLESSAGPAYGFIILDNSGLLFVRLKGNNWYPIQRVSFRLPRWKGATASESTLISKIMPFVEQSFVNPKTKTLFVEGIVIAGNSNLHKKLYDSLPKALKDKVIKVVDVQGEEEEGQMQALDHLEKELAHVRLIQEQLLLKKFFELKKTSAAKIAAGPKDALAALEAGGVERVIIYDGLRINRVSNGKRVVFWEEGTARTEVDDLGKQGIEEENLLHWMLTHGGKFNAEISLVSKNSRPGVTFWRELGIAVIKK
uniref:Predicted protein n=1 Tax=Hordeum vulgare subsp. vulgare TaxID=112509 RepID=F2E5G2_HORVV|nr:predicted protein [Hordeum vulgare subsp. vulgare]